MSRRVFPLVLFALGAVGTPGNAQRPLAPQGQATSLAAAGPTLSNWSLSVVGMLDDGRLRTARIQRDSLFSGRRHERLEQRHRGLPVFGGQVVRQLDGRAVVSVFGRIFEGIEIGMAPTLDEGAARLAAAAAESSDAVTYGDVVLGILPRPSGGYALVYRVGVRTRTDRLLSYVNAVSGTIERRDSRILAQAGTIGRGTGVFGDIKKVSTRRVSGSFEVYDALRPTPISTLDFGGNVFRTFDFLFNDETFASDVSRDSDNVWLDGPIVDAQVYQGWVHDYYFNRFNRLSLDDRGLPTKGIVHPLLREGSDAFSAETRNLVLNNALYLGEGVTLYGDGDGVVFDYLAGALDVIGHEMTHGVIEYSSALETHDEPGALNESFSDIMAASIEFFYQPIGSGPRRSEWLIAEDVTLESLGFLRSMDNPRRDRGSRSLQPASVHW